ncbi:38487_t:CDS:1, partial [Gigaspora margarita]
LAVILTALTDMFVKTKILTTNLCAPQSFSQYLTQVLAPETAIRLIAEAFNNISLEAAKEIMIDTVVLSLDNMYTMIAIENNKYKAYYLF